MRTAARPRSATTITGLRGRRSTQTPAGSPNSAKATNGMAPRMATSTGRRLQDEDRHQRQGQERHLAAEGAHGHGQPEASEIGLAEQPEVVA